MRGLRAPQFFVVVGEGEVDDGCAEEEDEGDETLGQDGESEGRPHDVGVEGWRKGARRNSGCFRQNAGILLFAQNDAIFCGW